MRVIDMECNVPKLAAGEAKTPAASAAAAPEAMARPA